MPAVAQVRLMDQGTAHSRRSSTELGALCQAWAELVRSSLVVLRRVYPVRQADWITNQQPVQGAGGALLGDARALLLVRSSCRAGECSARVRCHAGRCHAGRCHAGGAG